MVLTLGEIPDSTQYLWLSILRDSRVIEFVCFHTASTWVQATQAQKPG